MADRKNRVIADAATEAIAQANAANAANTLALAQTIAQANADDAFDIIIFALFAAFIVLVPEYIKGIFGS
jgi:hypothetical protein